MERQDSKIQGNIELRTELLTSQHKITLNLIILSCSELLLTTLINLYRNETSLVNLELRKGKNKVNHVLYGQDYTLKAHFSQPDGMYIPDSFTHTSLCL